MKSNVRIKDIAAAAGFSPSTVSFVLNGRGDEFGISSKTQEYILQIAQDCGYQPNIPAKKLRNAEHHTIPSIAILFAVNQYISRTSEVMLGIHNSISKNGVIADFNMKPFLNGALRQEFNTARSNFFNGAIIAGAVDTDVKALEEMSIITPVMFLNRTSEHYNSVYCDSYQIGYHIAEMFHERGHTNVGMVCMDNPFFTLNLRKQGFFDGCRHLNLTLNDENVKTDTASFAGGERSTGAILENASPPTAIFYLHDILAIGSLAAFRKHKVRVPEDIEIIAYGDNRFLEYTEPSISSVYAPIDMITYTAIDLLMQIISNGLKQPVQQKIDANIVIRDSFGK